MRRGQRGRKDTGNTRSAEAGAGDIMSLPASLPDPPAQGWPTRRGRGGGDGLKQGSRGTRTCVLEGPTARRGTLMSKPLLGSFSPRRAGSLKGSWPVSQSHTVFLMACRTLESGAHGADIVGTLTVTSLSHLTHGSHRESPLGVGGQEGDKVLGQFTRKFKK